MGFSADSEVAFIVAEHDIEARLVIFDEPPLCEQCLGFVADHHDLQVRHAVDQPAQLGRRLIECRGPEIALHTAAQRNGLSHVYDAAVSIAHDVAARLVRQVAQFLTQNFIHKIQLPRS